MNSVKLFLSLPATALAMLYTTRVQAYGKLTGENLFFIFIGVAVLLCVFFIIEISAKDFTEVKSFLVGLLFTGIGILVERFAFEVFKYQYSLPEIISFMIASFLYIFGLLAILILSNRLNLISKKQQKTR